MEVSYVKWLYWNVGGQLEGSWAYHCLVRIYINWNPYCKFLLSMNFGMRWSVSQSSGQCFCTEPMLLETHAIWSFQKQFLILGIRDMLKCNRKLASWSFTIEPTLNELQTMIENFQYILGQYIIGQYILGNLCPKVALHPRWVAH